MRNHVYKLLELTRSSSVSFEETVSTAIARAHETVPSIQWFTVTENPGPCGRWQGGAVAGVAQDRIHAGIAASPP